MSELRRLVQILTRPRKIDTRDDETGVLLAQTVHAPLLEELRAAKAANVGFGGGSKPPSERLSLNVGASDLYTEVEQRIRTWAIRAGYRPPRGGWPPLEQLLAHWHASTDGDPNLDPAHYAAVLRGWIAAIDDLLDPPYRTPILRPCPLCGYEWTPGDVDHGNDPNRALNLIRRDDPDASRIVCHVCGAEWHGIAGARRLARELETVEHDGHDLDCAHTRDTVGPLEVADSIRIPALQPVPA